MTPVTRFDHVALPTAHPEEMMRFYGALGFEVPDASSWRAAGAPFFSIHFGRQKINFHAPVLWQHEGFTLRGRAARPGCGDLCFVWEGGAESLHAALAAAGAAIEEGPVEREGGSGTGVSVYVRDPDENLVEFIVYD